MSDAADIAITELPGLDRRYLRQLEKEAMLSVRDLLLWFPHRHEDRRSSAGGGFQPSHVPVGHRVFVTKTSVKFFGRGRGRGVFEAQVRPVVEAPLGDLLTLRWWGMTFMSRTIAEGQELYVFGRIKEWKGRLSMDHPEYELVKEEEEDVQRLHTGRITPVYRLRGGVTQKAIRAAVWCALTHLGERLAMDLLPEPSITGEFAGWTASRALRTLHFPEDMDALETARRYLALEEFYAQQLRVTHRRMQRLSVAGRSLSGTGELTSALRAVLPFALTAAQERCVTEISADMNREMPMNRLLHGDVGSGKTIVAFFAILQAVESGAQATLMAPTQLLAEQHFETASRWLTPLGIEVALLTGTKKATTSGAALPSPSQPGLHVGPQVFVGTHALLHERGMMPNLGLVIIDEQHKFGVAQRVRLIEKGSTPDVLVMTATPIPRTLTLTVYGDLDVSTIDQRPKERGKVLTKVRPMSKQGEAVTFLQSQLKTGRQAYLVYPLIEESEKSDVAAAKKGHLHWGKVLPHFSVGLLHGKLSAEEKALVMRDFRDGKHEVLVATTVIEVGVDVPNATIMYVHHAERFGLAQLHQLRGRIGRGSQTSYCVLFVADDESDAAARLAILEQTHDGFQIAEEDLKRRGPGDLLGKAQSGQEPLRFAELLSDTRLVGIARKLAVRTLAADPKLEDPRFERIRDSVFITHQSQSILQ